MRFKFFFIFFSLIFGILTLSLKKKIQKNKYSPDYRSIFKKRMSCLRKPKKIGEECDTNEHCTSNNCEKGYCAKAIYTGIGASCVCGYHCTKGSCVSDQFFNFRCNKPNPVFLSEN
jgi:hypothetical protein